MNEQLILSCQLYANLRQLELAEKLGSGKDGIVLVAKNKTKAGESAVKTFRYKEAYFREKMIYELSKSP